MISKETVSGNSLVADKSRRLPSTHLITPNQLIGVSLVGVLFWFMAAMAVRYGTPIGFFKGTLGVATFILTVPVGWLTVLFVKRAVMLRSAQVPQGVALGTAAAAFCDGIALTWTPTLYGSGTEQILLGAAWILWGVGWILAFACITTYRDKGE